MLDMIVVPSSGISNLFLDETSEKTYHSIRSSLERLTLDCPTLRDRNNLSAFVLRLLNALPFMILSYKSGCQAPEYRLELRSATIASWGYVKV